MRRRKSWMGCLQSACASPRCSQPARQLFASRCDLQARPRSSHRWSPSRLRSSSQLSTHHFSVQKMKSSSGAFVTGEQNGQTEPSLKPSSSPKTYSRAFARMVQPIFAGDYSKRIPRRIRGMLASSFLWRTRLVRPGCWANRIWQCNCGQTWASCFE